MAGRKVFFPISRELSLRTRCTSQFSSIASLLLDLTDDGTFRHLADWQHISDGDRGYNCTNDRWSRPRMSYDDESDELS